jgi:hypothetical protein
MSLNQYPFDNLKSLALVLEYSPLKTRAKLPINTKMTGKYLPVRAMTKYGRVEEQLHTPHTLVPAPVKSPATCRIKM